MTQVRLHVLWSPGLANLRLPLNSHGWSWLLTPTWTVSCWQIPLILIKDTTSDDWRMQEPWVQTRHRGQACMVPFIPILLLSPNTVTLISSTDTIWLKFLSSGAKIYLITPYIESKSWPEQYYNEEVTNIKRPRCQRQCDWHNKVNA